MSYIIFTPSKVRELLKEAGVEPRDYLGQNFLVSNKIAERVAEEALLSPDDTVLEVGPGLGILTQELIKRAYRVIAVEKDRALSEYLLKKFARENVEIIKADILYAASDLTPLNVSRYSVVSNLPYSISARFLSTFMTRVHPKPEKMVLMLQKEVAERLIAKPGDMTKLSVLAQTYGDIEWCFTVSPEQFYPIPKVISAVVRINLKKNLPSIFPQHEDIFWRIVRIGFSSKRKMLYRNLTNGLHLPVEESKKLLKTAYIRENARAEELGVDAWLNLVDKYVKIY